MNTSVFTEKETYQIYQSLAVPQSSSQTYIRNTGRSPHSGSALLRSSVQPHQNSSNKQYICSIDQASRHRLELDHKPIYTLKALAHYNRNYKKIRYRSYTLQLFFTTTTILSTVLYMDNDSPNDFFRKIFVKIFVVCKGLQTDLLNWKSALQVVSLLMLDV